MLEWFRKQWRDIKGHVKYGILVSVPFIAGVLTRGLRWWQQLILAILYVFVVAWAIVQTIKADKLAQEKSAATEIPPSAVTKTHIYIGPGGMPVSIMGGGNRVRVDFVIFSAVNVELRYMKLLLSKIETPDQFVMLDSSEPMEIKALEQVNKNLQKSLTTDEITRLFGPTTMIALGSAKFSGGLEVPFTFPAIPHIRQD